MSSVSIGVSNGAWSDFRKQVRDAERFLHKHGAEIRRLGRRTGVEWLGLDFPIELRISDRKIVMQSDHFPPSLVREAARLGLGLEFTIYG